MGRIFSAIGADDQHIARLPVHPHDSSATHQIRITSETKRLATCRCYSHVEVLDRVRVQMSQALGRMSAAQRAVYVQHLQEDGDEGEDDGVVALNKDELKAASQWA